MDIEKIYPCIIILNIIRFQKPKTSNTMDSQFMKRFVLAPLIFLIVTRFISFFAHVLEIDESMYYILIALMSVPLVLYMIIG